MNMDDNIFYNNIVLSEDKVVLSARRSVLNETHITEEPILIGRNEASLIKESLMTLLVSSSKNVILQFFGCRFTDNAVDELERILYKSRLASRIVGTELSGTRGRDPLPPEEEDALKRLIKALTSNAPLKSVKLVDFCDRDIKYFRPLMRKEGATGLFFSHATISTMDRGLSKIEDILTGVVPGTTHQPCNSLAHFGYHRIVTDDEDAAADIVANILNQCTSIESFQYSMCNPGLEGSESILKAIAYWVLLYKQVCVSLKYIEIRNCIFNDKFGWLVALEDLKRLKHVDLRECNLTPTQKEKLKYKLGPLKREDPPILVLEDDEAEYVLEGIDELVLDDDDDENDDDNAEESNDNDRHEFESSQMF